MGMKRTVSRKKALRTAAISVMLQTVGKDLTMLKEGISATESIDAPVGDLSQLIYGNKHTVEIAEIMQHIALQGIVHPTSPRPIQVVSDIDDTLYAGWMDKRYPAHEIYPGVVEIFQLISRNSNTSTTFLTARPRGWWSIGQRLTVRHLVHVGIDSPQVLAGSLKGLTSNTRIAELKMENFRKYVTLYPEYNFVFFGDSSQGDALLALKMNQQFPDKMKGTFIHNVTPELSATGDGGCKVEYGSKGIDFFTTYLGAGIAASKAGLIDPTSLQSLVLSCQTTLQSMTFKSEKDRRNRQDELSLDMKRIKEILQI